VLTARDALASKREAFALGADDYLVKPFALAEVELRLTALHRRATGASAPPLRRLGALTLDLRTREVRVGAQPVRLGARGVGGAQLDAEAGARGLRAGAARQVVPRAELEAALWPHEPPASDALRAQIHLLRQALSAAGFTGLETVHGVGYRLRDPAA
ncbi:MAG: response regulator transcription factor, partial [Burkholderiaceae bacterium]|nr:response regulator transcription factor [Burkholderiaceae bacterium]